VPDETEYVYDGLSPDDDEHARSDDVRAAAMAVADVEENGLDEWLGASLSSPLLNDVDTLRDVVARGLTEVGNFLKKHSIQ